MSYEQAREQAAGREEADPDRLHRRQLRQLPADGEGVMPRPEVVDAAREFVTVQLYTDYVPIDSLTADQREELAEQNQELLLDLAERGDQPVLRRPDARRQGRSTRSAAIARPRSSSSS